MTVNSVIIENNAALAENGLTLTVQSGAVMSSNNVGGSTTATISGGTLNFGNAEGILFATFNEGATTVTTATSRSAAPSAALAG